MKKEYILFIDSGVGGLSTLAKTAKILPQNYIYFADNINSPYGNHSKEEIYSFVKQIVSEMTKKYNIKVVVLACNTATTSSAEKLRKNLDDLTIIGTEPAIKLAVDLGYKKILCLSTKVTTNQQKFLDLKDSLSKNNVTIFSYGLANFASDIDEFIINGSIHSNFNILKDLMQIKSLSFGKDAIVLGCTHYTFLADKIRVVTNLPVLDGNEGVANHVKEVFFKGKKYYKTCKLSIKFLNSSKLLYLNKKYLKIFKQILAKNQNV